MDFNPDISRQTIDAIARGNFISKGANIGSTKIVENIDTIKVVRDIKIDEEVANILNWLGKEQGISPKLALKKAVATAAYLHDVTKNQGGELLVKRKDNSVGKIVLK